MTRNFSPAIYIETNDSSHARVIARVQEIFFSSLFLSLINKSSRNFIWNVFPTITDVPTITRSSFTRSGTLIYNAKVENSQRILKARFARET